MEEEPVLLIGSMCSSFDKMIELTRVADKLD